MSVINTPTPHPNNFTRFGNTPTFPIHPLQQKGNPLSAFILERIKLLSVDVEGPFRLLWLGETMTEIQPKWPEGIDVRTAPGPETWKLYEREWSGLEEATVDVAIGVVPDFCTDADDLGLFVRELVRIADRGAIIIGRLSPNSTENAAPVPDLDLPAALFAAQDRYWIHIVVLRLDWVDVLEMGLTGSAAGLIPVISDVALRDSGIEQKSRDEILGWHTRTRVCDEALAAVCRSWSWKLTWPMRKLGRMLFPRTYGLKELLPWSQVERVGKAKETEDVAEEVDLELAAKKPHDASEDSAGGLWRSVGKDPRFLMPVLFPAGWVRFRIKLRGRGRQTFELFYDEGEGFQRETRIETADWATSLELDFLTRFRNPVRGIRLDPVSRESRFEIEEFRATVVPWPRSIGHAVSRKLKLLTSYNCLLPSLLRGVKLLATGQARTFVRKMWGALPDDRTMGQANVTGMYSYQQWREEREITSADRRRMRDYLANWTNPPLISIVMPVFNTPKDYLDKAIRSVLKQTYPHFEICIVDDGSTDSRVIAKLRSYADHDPRIKLRTLPKNLGISGACNAGLAMARGEYVAILDHDDELAEHALFRVAEYIRANPKAVMFYSDEDKLDEHGRHVDAYFKPDWSHELFMSCMYTCHLSVYRTDRLRAIGGYRPAYDGAQDYDMVLRLVADLKKETIRPDGITSEGEKIVHIPDILYHWRRHSASTAGSVFAKPEAWQAGKRAIEEYLAGIGEPGVVERANAGGCQRVRYKIRGTPKISIIIPSTCKPALVRNRRTTLVEHCIASIRTRTSYPNFEIMVLTRGRFPAEVETRLDTLEARRISYDFPFNWSAVNNFGVTQAAGDYLLFLNDDMEVINPDWLEAMLEYAQHPGVGAVGARLLFPNRRIQHVGVCLLEGHPSHAFYNSLDTVNSHGNTTGLARNFSAVTGACLMTRSDVFQRVGGFDTTFPLNFNDVDFCLRVVEEGYRIVMQPTARLYHWESVTKTGVFKQELAAFCARWKAKYMRDPMYNPNFTVQFPDLRLRPPAVAGYGPFLEMENMARAVSAESDVGSMRGQQLAMPLDRSGPDAR